MPQPIQIDLRSSQFNIQTNKFYQSYLRKIHICLFSAFFGFFERTVTKGEACDTVVTDAAETSD